MDTSAPPEADDYIPCDTSEPSSSRARTSCYLPSGTAYERLRRPSSGVPTTAAPSIRETVPAKKAPHTILPPRPTSQTTTTAAETADSDAESVASVATHDSVPVASIAATELAKRGESDAFAHFVGLQATPLDAPLAAHHLQGHRFANVLIDIFGGAGTASHGVALSGVTPDIHLCAEIDPLCRGVFRTHFPRAAIFRSFESMTPEKVSRTLEAALGPFIAERTEFGEAERAFNPQYVNNPYIAVTIVAPPLPCPPFSRFRVRKPSPRGKLQTLSWAAHLRGCSDSGKYFRHGTRYGP